MHNDGGPAFPMIRDQRYTPDWDHEPGMPLRDYFATEALSVVATLMAAGLHEPGPTEQRGAAFIAASAYRIADAMLAERSKESSK